MNVGLHGQKLRYVDEIGVRLTTWAWYVQFRADIARSKAEARERRLEAVRVALGRAK
jgi:hypothetical protein